MRKKRGEEEEANPKAKRRCEEKRDKERRKSSAHHKRLMKRSWKRNRTGTATIQIVWFGSETSYSFPSNGFNKIQQRTLQSASTATHRHTHMLRWGPQSNFQPALRVLFMFPEWSLHPNIRFAVVAFDFGWSSSLSDSLRLRDTIGTENHLM